MPIIKELEKFLMKKYLTRTYKKKSYMNLLFRLVIKAYK